MKLKLSLPHDLRNNENHLVHIPIHNGLTVTFMLALPKWPKIPRASNHGLDK